MNLPKALTVFVAWTCLIPQLPAQEPLALEKPAVPGFARPYVGPVTPPARLQNSNRIYSLIRAGKLYLTVQDAIALAMMVGPVPGVRFVTHHERRTYYRRRSALPERFGRRPTCRADCAGAA